MKENKLSIRIRKSVSDVYEFTTNPRNTHLWIDLIEKEEASKWPVEIGTIYRNKDIFGNWSEYIVTKLKPQKTFELVSKDNNYHVRYTYTKINSRES